MRKMLCSLSLLAFTSACNNNSLPSSNQSTANKGKDEFRTRMSQGTGVFRPEILKTATTLNLAGNTIASTKLDEHSGAWSWVGFDTTQGEAIKADADLFVLAKEFLKKNEVELGFKPDEVLLQDGGIQKPYPNTRMITLRRQYQGTEVKGAFINIFFAIQADGSLRLSEVVNNSYGPIKITGEAAAAIDEAAAREITGVNGLKLVEKRAVVSPQLRDGRYDFSYATELLMNDPETGEKITLTVDNASRSIHEAYSNRVYETHEINAETYMSSYVLKDLVTRPLEFLQLTDNNQNLTTNEKGLVDTDLQKWKVILHNTKNNSSIYSASNTSQPISFDLTLDPSKKTVIKFGQASTSGLNVYASVTETINFAAKYLNKDELKLIENGFNSQVDINQSCNAYYDGSLNFFSQSKDCANTALISDVVKHEWGHGLDDFLGPTSRQNSNRSGITDAAYSEGIGDILAGYIAKSPDMGRGFFLNDPKALRVLNNTRTHPPANKDEGEVHSLGLVIGGAFWDMHVNLAKIYGEDVGNDVASKLFLRHLITSDRYVDAFQAVLRVDDDDNNPMTRSPSYCAITRAFSRHGISGGEKAADDCTDVDSSINVKVDQDLGEGKLSFVLSAGGAAKIVGCAGKVNSCKSGAPGFVEFATSDGDDLLTLKGKRKFYAAKATIDVKANPEYTFFSLDSTGAAVAKRAFEIKSGSTDEPKESTK